MMNGTDAQPITLTRASASPAHGDWYNLEFDSNSSFTGNTVSYVKALYGGSTTGGIYVNTITSPLSLNNVTVDHSRTNGVLFNGSSGSVTPNISATTVTNNA